MAATLDGPAQGAVWIVALLTDFLSSLVAGSGGWRVPAGHFAAPHGLIVTIALEAVRYHEGRRRLRTQAAGA